MKILMISVHDIWGSLDTFSPMKQILTGLGNRGVQTEFVSISKPKHIDRPSGIYGEPVEFIHDNVHITRLKILDNSLCKFLYKLPVISKILKKIRRDMFFSPVVYRYFKKNIKSADIVYAYEIFAVPVAEKIAKKLNVPLVTRFQGSFLYDWENKYGEKYCREKFKLHYKALSTPADLIVMTNDGTQGDRILKKLGNDENMRFWRNGFNFKPLDTPKENLRAELGLENDKYYTVSVCRLAKWKKLERIIEAYRFIDNEKIKHIFVGDGEEREFLQSLIDEYGLKDRFIFAGDTPHKDVAKYLQASDVFLSFFDSTNVGNPLLEAIKINLPIITYDVGDTNTVIDGTNGILLDKPDPEKISDTVNKIIIDDAFRNELIEGAKKTSAKLWSWSDRIEEEYKELCKLKK